MPLWAPTPSSACGTQPTMALLPKARCVPGGVRPSAPVAGAADWDCAGCDCADWAGALVAGWFPPAVLPPAGAFPLEVPPEQAARTGKAVAVITQAAVRPGFMTTP